MGRELIGKIPVGDILIYKECEDGRDIYTSEFTPSICSKTEVEFSTSFSISHEDLVGKRPLPPNETHEDTYINKIKDGYALLFKTVAELVQEVC